MYIHVDDDRVQGVNNASVTSSGAPGNIVSHVVAPASQSAAAPVVAPAVAPSAPLMPSAAASVMCNQPFSGMSNACTTEMNACASKSKGAVYMPIVKVRVNGTETVNALLDSASTNTFCSRNLVHKLGLEGKREPRTLNTLGGVVSQDFEMVGLSVVSMDGEEIIMSGVGVVDNIPISSACINTEGYDHLKGIDFSVPGHVDHVDLLIGQNYSECLLPLEVSKGKRGEPYAIRTIFGWCLNGKASPQSVSHVITSHFISASVVPETRLESIEKNVNRLWDIENEGLLESDGWSVEDRSVMSLWDDTCRKVDGHYELPIPWKDRDETLPNNYCVAKGRLDSLVKKLHRDGNYERYDEEINKLVTQGYAEPVPVDDISNATRVWYLPHHAVVSDKKPGKVRVVYDCASKFRGKSLNDRCLQGPDLVNKLLHVLLRFRLHSYAIQADIEAMYHQIRIPMYDRDALRFLWLTGDEVVHLRMTSHLFGGVWCASSSTYALRRTISDCDSVHPLAQDTIENSFYVDDCLRSVDTKPEVSIVVNETSETLKQGGFNLTKFIINDMELLSNIPEDHRAKEVKDLSPDISGKVLGIKWDIQSDTFFFEFRNVMEKPVTRRNMLSLVSSLYDPLGLIGPLTLTGKLLFQQATRLRLGWDEAVPNSLASSWKQWLQCFDELSSLRFPRCVKHESDATCVVELHHFCDASLEAYGALTYLRCVNKEGQVSVQLLMSKNRVAPIKQSTVPRLELQAAVVAAKMDSLLKRQLDIKIDMSYFWTDSQIVLGYIKNCSRRFHVYVANRIGLISQLTNTDTWHHVSSEHNPADLLTRAKYRTIHDLNDMWFHGPSWLRGYKCDWPASDFTPELSQNDPEVKSCHAIQSEIPQCTAMPCVYDAPASDSISVSAVADPEVKSCHAVQAAIPESSIMSQVTDHYSSWLKMQRALAWLMRWAKGYTNRSITRGALTFPEVKRAKLYLIKQCQIQYYSEEMRHLDRGDHVKKSSPIAALKPYLDSDGLMRVGGRTNEHPYILPPNHNIAKAIVSDVHGCGHVGVEWTLSLVRREYWIIKARPLVKRIIGVCVPCKRLYGRPSSQIMADLPPERTEIGKPPFTNVGIDVFGPYTVKNYRSEIKRYGCIFTCLVTRAVHIEKLNTLDTNSFINAMRRFVARRGCPSKVFSDNGTNFVAGESELRRSLRELSAREIQAYAVKCNMDWTFIPPSAPHWGGAWERMVGAIKRVMKAVLSPSARLTDEILETVFCEIESILNGRPMTKLSSDPNDVSPLTPNHLLLLRHGPSLPPGKFDGSDMYRRRWRHIQHLADQFWQKWTRLYLPELQKRTKWLDINRNLAVGDLVLVCENTPRNLWPLALVKEVTHGRDGLVRSVRLRTRAAELVRPITKVVFLEATAKQ